MDTLDTPAMDAGEKIDCVKITAHLSTIQKCELQYSISDGPRRHGKLYRGYTSENLLFFL